MFSTLIIPASCANLQYDACMRLPQRYIYADCTSILLAWYDRCLCDVWRLKSLLWRGSPGRPLLSIHGHQDLSDARLDRMRQSSIVTACGNRNVATARRPSKGADVELGVHQCRIPVVSFSDTSRVVAPNCLFSTIFILYTNQEQSASWHPVDRSTPQFWNGLATTA